MIGHLGARVSALLDGQLPPAEAERAWAHVHACHACRDLVEREGWIKTSLAGLSQGPRSAPDHLKGSLLGPSSLGSPRHPEHLADHHDRSHHRVGLVAMGGGAVGAAFLGVLALGVAPADSPTNRPQPTTSLTRHTDAPRFGTPVPATQLHRIPTP